MARIYASPTDLAGVPWNLTLAEPEALSLLHRASLLVESLTLTAHYAVDDELLPLHAPVKEAFRDATCAQALWFDETGDISGASARFNTLSLGSFGASGGGTSAATNVSAGSSRISPEAISILRTAGLLHAGPSA